MTTNGTVCPICQDEAVACDAVTPCGHHACSLCAMRVAATTRCCWMCRRPISELRVGAETIPISEPSEAADSIVVQANPTEFFPVIFLVDHKVVVVSFVAGLLTYSLFFAEATGAVP